VRVDPMQPMLKGPEATAVQVDPMRPMLKGPGATAVQVDPMTPMLKGHGAKRLKLKCDNLLSSVAFKFNLRRYTPAGPAL